MAEGISLVRKFFPRPLWLRERDSPFRHPGGGTPLDHINAKRARKFAAARDFLRRFVFLYPTRNTNWDEDPFWWIVQMAEALHAAGLRIFLGGHSRGSIGRAI